MARADHERMPAGIVLARCAEYVGNAVVDAVAVLDLPLDGQPVKSDRIRLHPRAGGVDDRPCQRTAPLSRSIPPENDEGRRVAALARKLRMPFPGDRQNLGVKPQVRGDRRMCGEWSEIVAAAPVGM